MYEVSKDETGKIYIEIPSDADDRIRLTLVEQGWPGRASIRIQVRDEKGHLRQGPEVAIDRIGDVVGAAFQLLTVRFQQR
jgi:hypothetical protein